MAYCFVCHDERGWLWRTFMARDWMKCQLCKAHYCGKCFPSLRKVKRDTWWSEKSVRLCRQCRSDIDFRIPDPPGVWPY